jgi:hypothetical protein
MTRLYRRGDLPEEQCRLRARLVSDLPPIYPTFYIRPAWVEEAAVLSDLCFARSWYGATMRSSWR